MKWIRLVGPLILMVSVLSGQACAADLTTEQKQLVADLKDDLGRIRQEIERAAKDNEAYAGGLIKALIGVRLEILKTNAALVEQRIHAIEAGTRMTVVVNIVKTDPIRAAELAKEIESQKIRVADARTQANRYSGGLVQAMAEAAVATARNTLAMLEQQYFVGKYGLTIPSAPSEVAESTPGSKIASTSRAAEPNAATPSRPVARDCLKIETFDSSILSTNDVFTELAWKVDVVNACTEPFGVRVMFTIYDKDEFKLDSDSKKFMFRQGPRERQGARCSSALLRRRGV